VPKGYVCNVWYDYGECCTIEEITDIETARSIKKAKQIRDIGVQILNGAE
jgi:hypothetical protein